MQKFLCPNKETSCGKVRCNRPWRYKPKYTRFLANFRILGVKNWPIPGEVCISKRWSMVILYQLWNFKGPRPLAPEIWASEKVDFDWVEMIVLFFSVSGPKFTKFGTHVREWSPFATPFSNRWYLAPVRRYSRSSREVVRNLAKILMFLGRQIFFGEGPPIFWLNFINYSH